MGGGVLEQGPPHSTPQHHSCLGFQILVSQNRMCPSPWDDSTHPQTSPQCSLGWSGAPGAQGPTSSPPWPGPEPGCQLPAGLAPNPINVTESLLTALSPALARAATPQEDSSLQPPSLYQCQAAHQGFCLSGWSVPPLVQINLAQEGRLSAGCTTLKLHWTASALLRLGGQDRLRGRRKV